MIPDPPGPGSDLSGDGHILPPPPGRSTRAVSKVPAHRRPSPTSQSGSRPPPRPGAPKRKRRRPCPAAPIPRGRPQRPQTRRPERPRSALTVQLPQSGQAMPTGSLFQNLPVPLGAMGGRAAAPGRPPPAADPPGPQADAAADPPTARNRRHPIPLPPRSAPGSRRRSSGRPASNPPDHPQGVDPAPAPPLPTAPGRAARPATFRRQTPEIQGIAGAVLINRSSGGRPTPPRPVRAVGGLHPAQTPSRQPPQGERLAPP